MERLHIINTRVWKNHTFPRFPFISFNQSVPEYLWEAWQARLREDLEMGLLDQNELGHPSFCWGDH